MNKFDRTNFLNKNIIKGKVEYDLKDCNWDLLDIRKQLYGYVITYDDIGRPDRISNAIYGTDQYWWVILKFNNICDVYNELEAATKIYAPHEDDLQDWYLKVKTGNKINGN